LEGAVREAVGWAAVVVEGMPRAFPRAAPWVGLLALAGARVNLARVSDEVPLGCAITALSIVVVV
jgi:hypothetical protein